MGDVINLRRVRKAKAKGAAEAQSAENRARHGRTTSEKKRDDSEAKRLAGIVDGARLAMDESA